MNVEISRNQLAGALSALGKSVSRTSPVEAHRSLRIEGKDGKILFQTVGLDESVTFALPAKRVEEFQAVVRFEEFRTVARYGRNKSLVLEFEPGKFSVDHIPLALVQTVWPTVAAPSSDAVISVLPENFVAALAKAAPIVDRHEPRRVLQGIHLCRDGVVATNGKELVNIPLPLAVDPLTIPFPLALLATKCDEEGTLTTWNDKEQRFFSIALGNWTWTGKALMGNYPDWRKVVPDAATLKHVVQLDADRAAQLEIFLKNVPADPPNHPVRLLMGDDRETLDVVAGESQTSVRAEFPTDWGDFGVSVNREILLRQLTGGYHRLAFGDERSPFIATGDMGRVIAMPLAFVPKDKPQTVQPKEEKPMNAMQNPVGTVSMPSVTHQSATTPEPIVMNPMEELGNAVEEFKLKIRTMFEEATNLSRKVKEAALAQKQKERDFIQAKRALERIRMAI